MRGFVDGLLLWYLLRAFPTKNSILEIGSYQGQTAGLFFDCLPDANLTCIDIVDNLNLFRKNYKDHLAQHQLILQSSQTIQLDNKIYDIVFIDGDHSYDACRSDIQLALSCINNDGILVVDDYQWPEVKRAIDDFYLLPTDWVPFMQGLQCQFWHHRSQNKSAFLDGLLTDPIANFLLIRNVLDHQNNVILQAECVRMLTDHYDIFNHALIMYDI